MGFIAGILEQWTSGLDEKSSRIEVFSRIRDIPYAVIEGQLNLKRGPERLIKEGKGSCTPKHYLLGLMLGSMGIDVNYCTYSFRWNDMSLDYPGILKELGEVIPVTYHLACRVLLGGRWVLLDATWDSPLKNAGFPVNTGWDGESDTELAITPIDEVTHGNAQDREEYIRARYGEYSLTDKLQLSRLSLELNRWLEGIRSV